MLGYRVGEKYILSSAEGVHQLVKVEITARPDPAHVKVRLLQDMLNQGGSVLRTAGTELLCDISALEKVQGSTPSIPPSGE